MNFMDNSDIIVLISKQARKDLHCISKYLSQFSKKYYLKFYQKFIKNISLIKFFPEMYPLLDKDYTYRKMVIDKYVVFYTIRNNVILIVRIFSCFENYINKI